VFVVSKRIKENAPKKEIEREGKRRDSEIPWPLRPESPRYITQVLSQLENVSENFAAVRRLFNEKLNI
jgi:hypothetical protein